MQPNNFTLFVFNDISLTNLPTRIVDDQNSVRHKPTYKRKTVKIQIDVLKTATTKLQGDTSAKTSATNQLELLHDYWPFKKTKSVGVDFQNNDSLEVITLEAYNIEYIYIYIYILSLIKERQYIGRQSILHRNLVLSYLPTIIFIINLMNNLACKQNQTALIIPEYYCAALQDCL